MSFCKNDKGVIRLEGTTDHGGMSLFRYAVSALKGIVFLGGLYLLGRMTPFCLPGLDEGFRVAPFFNALFLLIIAALVFFLCRSRFFAQARQWLKPVWYPAVLVWLIPFVGLMVSACIKGRNNTGFPLPGNRGGHDEPWDSIFAQVMPETAIVMLCVLAVACLIVRVMKRPPTGVIRVMVLAVFIAECLRSVHIGLFDYFGASTWGPGEMLEEILFQNSLILLFWLGSALVPAWHIVGELILRSSHPSAEGLAARGILKTASMLATSVVCGVFLLYSITAWSLPSVDALKTTEGLRTLLRDNAVDVRLTPLRETPPYVANAFATYYGAKHSHISDYITDLASLFYRQGVSDLEEDVLYLTIKFFLSREEILSAWLTTRSFGDGLRGPAAAARKYFNKSFAELNLCEATMLAPIAYPLYIHPFDDPTEAKERQQALLDDMVKLGLISEADQALCQEEP